VTAAILVAGPAGASSKPPVKLQGKVNDEGVGKVKNGNVDIESNGSGSGGSDYGY
jgi:hypothetical protein